MKDRQVSDQEVIDFIADENNKDFLEQVSLELDGYEGWAKLSSGTRVYITQPQPTPEEMGNIFKRVLLKLEDQSEHIQEIKKTFDKYDISIINEDGTYRSTVDVLVDLAKL